MRNICILGFGNIAHALIANNQNSNIQLTVFTDRKLNVVSNKILNQVDALEGYYKISQDIKEAISCADVVILTLPTHIRKDYLLKIKPYLRENTVLGAMPGLSGFNEEVDAVFGAHTYSIFSLQRVPFISRVLEKGCTVCSHKKSAIDVAISGNVLAVQEFLKDFLKMKVHVLSHFDSVNLSNSNPLLHTARIYSFMKNKSKPYYIDVDETFYGHWTLDASETLLKMDQEFIDLINKLKLPNVKDLLTHYGVQNAKELTEKIQSIESFKGIDFPKKKNNEGHYLVDLDSRYFKEDFEYGLNYLKNRARSASIKTENIDLVLESYKNYVTEE